MMLLDPILSRLIRDGGLIITDYDGKRYTYGTAATAATAAGTEPPVHIRFTARNTAWRIARNPRLGAGETFMDGTLAVEPPHDIRDLILLVMRNAARPGAVLDPPGLLHRTFDKLAWRLDQIGSRTRARRNVEHHYDLSRQFYELFLDEDRQYTMAYWRDPAGTLEQAQLDKKALIAAKLRLGPRPDGSPMRVLDIGCGWGGLALYLNRHYGCEVLGISLAPDQVRFAQERAEAAGVADQVSFRLLDYRDLDGQFDRITSVGMIEHVGASHFAEYFAKTFRLLADDGIMLTHTIGRTDGPGRTDAWTRKHIFPGGYIPAMSELVGALEPAGWQLGDIEILRYHYAHTLHEWYNRTAEHEAEITALYDARLFRMWLFYLAGAEQSFRNGAMVNFHLQTVKSQAVLPLTREYIAAEAARLGSKEQAPEWHLARAAE